MSVIHSIKKFINQISNIKNWQEYSYHKKKMRTGDLVLVTRPNPIAMKMDYDAYLVFKEIFIEDFYKINSILKKVRTNAVVLDIGANTGFFSYLILSKLKSAKVFAFEPFKKNVQLINATISRNVNIKDNLVVIEKAVTDKHNEEIKFYVDESAEQTSIASIYNNFDNRNTGYTIVKTTNLENILKENNIDKIDILKLDCEGAEYPILYNASDDLLKKINLMLIEAHPLDNDKLSNESLVKHLQQKGFRTTSKKFKNNCYYTLAENTMHVK